MKCKYSEIMYIFSIGEFSNGTKNDKKKTNFEVVFLLLLLLLLLVIPRIKRDALNSQTFFGAGRSPLAFFCYSVQVCTIIHNAALRIF